MNNCLRIANFHYFPGHLHDLEFETEDGPRRFKVVISAAYNAFGLIGSEQNGIAILDEDNSRVLLDNHVQASSGYFGPTTAQKLEMERILAMEWEEFRETCNTVGRGRGYEV